MSRIATEFPVSTNKGAADTNSPAGKPAPTFEEPTTDANSVAYARQRVALLMTLLRALGAWNV